MRMKGDRVGCAVAGCIFGATGLFAEPVRFLVQPDVSNGLYRMGNKATVEVRATAGKDAVKGRAEVWVDDGWTNVVWRRTVDLASEPSFKIEGLSRSTPGSLRIHLRGDGMRERMDRILFDWEKIQPFTPYPADFEEYWRGERKRLDREVPIAVEKTRASDLDTPNHEMYRVSFATFKGGRVYGLLAVPKGAGRFPFIVNVPGAGIGDFRIRKQVLRNGWGTLVMNVHGFPLGTTEAEQKANYNAWFAEYATKKGEPRYQYVGYSESREAPFYHAVMLGMARAIDWLAAEPYADASRFVYYGCSQGGGFGLYLTALYGRFAKSLILCPNKCDMLAYRQGREPGSSHIMNQKPENRAKAEVNAPYHDNCNFARMIQTPIRMVYGMADDNCQTVGGIAAYNSIASKDKELRLLPGVGHGWHTAGFDAWLFSPPDPAGQKR